MYIHIHITPVSIYIHIPVRNTLFCVTFLNFLLHRKTQKTKEKKLQKNDA